ncbi:MAG: NADPH:quinone oxidoreductase family protein [Pseudomonadota bacterium]
MADKVRVWQASDVGAPLTLAQAPRPEPQAGEVRIRVRACGLNFADTLMLRGRYQEAPPIPIVPGMELSGRVETLGPEVSQPPVGTRVAVYAGYGGLAEAVCVPAAACVPVPDTIDMETAAAFQIVYGTAHLALARRAGLQPGERLVVTGAAGGTGLATVQIGALLGAEVIAIARGAEKLEIARQAGATHTLDASTEDLRTAIKDLGGADVVVDTVGAPLWDAIFRAANPEARLFPIGFAGGTVPELRANHLLVKNLTICGFYWGGYLRFAPRALADSLGQVLDWMSSGALTLRIGTHLPFEEAVAGLDLLRDRKATGKIVVTFPE